MDNKKIEKALKRLEGAEVRVIIRGGRVVKIPKQELELPLKDGVQDKKIIPADIDE